MEIIDHRRRTALRLFSLATIGLSVGCARVPLAKQTYEAFTTKLPDPDQYPVTADRIANSPYALIGARFEGQAKVVMTLGTVDNRRLNWVSSNHLILSTQDELLVSTIGLPVDLVTLSVVQRSPIMTLQPGEQTASSVYRRQLTKRRSGQEEWIDVVSRYQNVGLRDVKVSGNTRSLWLIKEQANYHNWRWETVNQYWIDPVSRFTWRSRQQFTPEINALGLDVLKPYA